MVSRSSEVEEALKAGRPVVALESTVIDHGLPVPHNLETAIGCEEEVRSIGALPATMAIVGGEPIIGLDKDRLRELATREDVVKVNPANLAMTLARGQWGATTVAASLLLAERARS